MNQTRDRRGRYTTRHVSAATGGALAGDALAVPPEMAAPLADVIFDHVPVTEDAASHLARKVIAEATADMPIEHVVNQLGDHFGQIQPYTGGGVLGRLWDRAKELGHKFISSDTGRAIRRTALDAIGDGDAIIDKFVPEKYRAAARKAAGLARHLHGGAPVGGSGSLFTASPNFGQTMLADARGAGAPVGGRRRRGGAAAVGGGTMVGGAVVGGQRGGGLFSFLGL